MLRRSVNLQLLLLLYQACGVVIAAQQQQPPQQESRAASLQVPTTTAASSNKNIVKSSQDSSRKLVSETSRSQPKAQQQQQNQRKKQVDRRNGANIPELTLEDESSDSYLAEEATFDSGGGAHLGAASGLMLDPNDGPSSSSFAPDYETESSELVDVSGQAQHMRPNNQQASQLRAQRQSPLHQQLSPPSTTPGLINQRQAQQQVRVQQQQQLQRPVAQSPLQQMPRNQLISSSTPSTFNLNMGADRMLIKQQLAPHHQVAGLGYSGRQHQLMGDQQELTHTESIQRELLSRAQALPGERHQELLLYPSATTASSLAAHQHQHQHHLQNHNLASAEHLREVNAAQTSICYTPAALLMVILTTMLITVLVSFAVHYLIKQLSRRQFDLIANSKHFETKHGYSQGANEARTFTSSGASRCSLNRAEQLEAASQLRHSENMLNMLYPHQTGEQDKKLQQLRQQQQLRDEHGCAFDNPYFRDEPASLVGGYALSGQRQLSGKSLASADNCVHTFTGQDTANELDQRAPAREKEAPRSEQLNFIEHHISNLHSRQVTSSVKELSVLGSPNSHHVVDLTSAEQRAKVIADPKEGDLIAVDITGHDFIGLGFDVCGNAQEGIFVRSVLSRGPARESGCIQPGDRVKCLNISFENITLQDACDILNCGSPYKLRLLLEKRAAPSKLVEKLRQPAPIVMRRNHRYNNGNIQHLHHLPDLRSSAAHSSDANSNLFRSYLRRVVQFLTPKSMSQQQQQQGWLDYRQQFGIRSPNELHEPPLYLGSAAARRQLLQGRGSTLSGTGLVSGSGGAQVNAGYTGSDGDTVDNLFVGEDFAHTLAARRRLSMGSLGPATMLASSNGRFLKHSELFGGSNETGVAAAAAAAADSSLEYHSKNANHKLHGPAGCFLADTNERVFTLNSNRLLSSGSHEASTMTVGAGAQLRRIGGQQQLVEHNQRKLDHLEQTQSQPEIAHSNHLTNASSSDLTASQQQSRTNTSRRPIVNSISTPAMNLLASSNSQNQQDWQTLSPTPTRKKDNRKSIREEPSSENSSYADSTSKLVNDSSIDSSKHLHAENQKEKSKTSQASGVASRATSTGAASDAALATLSATTNFPPSQSHTLAADSSNRHQEIQADNLDDDDVVKVVGNSTTVDATAIKENNR